MRGNALAFVAARPLSRRAQEMIRDPSRVTIEGAPPTGRACAKGRQRHVRRGRTRGRGLAVQHRGGKTPRPSQPRQTLSRDHSPGETGRTPSAVEMAARRNERAWMRTDLSLVAVEIVIAGRPFGQRRRSRRARPRAIELSRDDGASSSAQSPGIHPDGVPSTRGSTKSDRPRQGRGHRWAPGRIPSPRA